MTLSSCLMRHTWESLLGAQEDRKERFLSVYWVPDLSDSPDFLLWDRYRKNRRKVSYSARLT